ERGIQKYLVYNPYHDHYEASQQGKELLWDVCKEIKDVLREEEINRLKGIRIRTEKYSAKELNVLFHSFEEKYIKVKQPPLYEYGDTIGGIVSNMLFKHNWHDRPDIIIREAAENILKHFNLNP